MTVRRDRTVDRRRRARRRRTTRPALRVVEHDGDSVTLPRSRTCRALGWRAYRLLPSGQRRPGLDAGDGGDDRATSRFQVTVDPRAVAAWSQPARRRARAARARAASATSSSSTRSTPTTRASARAPGTCCPSGPVVDRGVPCGADGVASSTRPLGERITVTGTARHRPLHPDAHAVGRRRPARRAPRPSTSTTAPTGCCGCAGRPTCRAGCRCTRSADAVIGRGFGFVDVDTARAPVDAGQPGEHLVRAGPPRARR